MNSWILSIATRFLLPLLLVFGLFLLFRGHNEVGGGFAAGLVAAVAVALYLFGLQPSPATRRRFPLRPVHLIALGLAVAGGSGVLGLLAGREFLHGLWYPHELAFMGGFHFGTPFVFDVGVCLVSAGSLLLVIDLLEEEEERDEEEEA